MTPDSNRRTATGRTARRLTTVLVCLLLATQLFAAGVAAAPRTAHANEAATAHVGATATPPSDDAGATAAGVETVTAVPAGPSPAAGVTDPDPDNGTNESAEDPPDHRKRPYGTGIRVSGSGLDPQTTTSGPIDLTYVVDRMKGDANVSVSARVSLPSNVNEFTVVQLPDDASVTGTSNFSKTADGDWETTQSSATLTYEMPFRYSPPWGLESTDEGSWAFTGQPAYSVRFTYRYSGSDPGYELTSESASGNAVGNDFLFWGPRRVIRVSDAETPIEIVVPDAASYTSAVTETLQSADENFTVGNRGTLTRAFAAPDPIREGGRTEGAIDSVRGFWVGDGASPNNGNNVWVHEYVHTRQTFYTDSETRWFLEGSAEYYATYLTAEEGRIDFQAFHDSVTTENYRDAVLSDPNDWSGTLANYEKGAHVLAALDAKIRAESGGSGTLEDAFATMNDDTGYLYLSEFKDAVETAAGTSLDGWIDQYVTTSDIPSVPDDPAAFGFGSGGGGKTTVQLNLQANATALEAGDDVRFTVRRADSGATVDATVSVDGSTYATGSDGEVVVGFDSTGTYTATATKSDTDNETFERDSLTVTVDPASEAAFEVRDLSVPDSAVEGDGVPVSATVDNVGDARGEVTVAFRVNGTTAATRTVTLDAGASTSVSATLSPGPGDHRIAVVAGEGEANGTVTVKRRATFEVTGFPVPDAAKSGDRIRVNGTVENVGGVAGTTTVTYRFDRTDDGDFDDGADVERTATVEVAPGESATVPFDVSLSGLQAGTYSHQFATPNDSARATTTVRAPPEYELSDPSVPGSVGPNESVSLSVQVRNAGPDAVEGTLSFRVDVDGDGRLEPGESLANESLYLAPNASVPIYLDASTDGVPPGQYTWGLVTRADEVTGTITVGGADNAPPNADAGSNRTVAGGGTVTLDGSGSSDPDGDPLSYRWEQTDGPSATVSNATSGRTAVTVPEVDARTTLTFALTVDDGSATATDTVAVTVTPSTSDRANRTVGTAEVQPGGSVEVTLSVELASPRDAVSVQDGFEGPVAGSQVESITLDGEPVDPVFAQGRADGVTVAVESVPADSTLSVTYAVAVAEDADPGDEIAYTGADGDDVAAGDFAAEFGTDAVAVVEASGPVERFDEDGDGGISTDELNAAIQAWATGEISTDDLNAVVRAWATS